MGPRGHIGHIFSQKKLTAERISPFFAKIMWPHVAPGHIFHMFPDLMYQATFFEKSRWRYSCGPMWPVPPPHYPRGDIPVPNVASRPHRPHFFRPKKYTPKKGHISRPHRPHFFAKKVNCKPDFAILAKIMWPQVAQAT